MSCCCGSGVTRGCLQVELNTIGTTAECVGADDRWEGYQGKINNYITGGVKNSAYLRSTFDRAGIPISDRVVWSEIEYNGPKPGKARSDRLSEICRTTPEYSSLTSEAWYAWFVQDDSNYVYLIFIEPVLGDGGYGEAWSGNYRYGSAFHVAKTASAVADIGDPGNLNSAAWSWTYYRPLDPYNQRTGQEEWFEQILDFSSSTINFTLCSECVNELPIVVSDSRDDIDEITGKYFGMAKAEVSGLYFGGKPSHTDQLISLFLLERLESPLCGLAYGGGNFSLMQNYASYSYCRSGYYAADQACRTEFPWFRQVGVGMLKSTYSGGAYTGGAPQVVIGLTKMDWDSAAANFPLDGTSRTVSNVNSDTTSFPPGFSRKRPSGEVVIKNNMHRSVGFTSPGGFTEGLSYGHDYLALNSIGFSPVKNECDNGYEGMCPYSPRPVDPSSGLYCGSGFIESEFEKPTGNGLWTRDYKHSRPSPNYSGSTEPGFSENGGGISGGNRGPSPKISGERLFSEDSLIFAVAETSDGSNWTVYPCVLIQQWMPLYHNYGYFLELYGNDLKGTSEHGVNTHRDSEPQGDTLSSRSSSRLTYTVGIASTPVAVTGTDPESVVVEALRGWSGSLTAWTPPAGFGIQGYSDNFGNTFDDNQSHSEYHIPPGHGNSLFSQFNNISIEIGDCDGNNPCEHCKCGMDVDILLPCDATDKPFNDPIPGGPCQTEIREIFLSQSGLADGCDETVAASCEGCTSGNTATVTIGGVANNFCTSCSVANNSFVLGWNLTPLFLTANPTYGAICAGWSGTFTGSACTAPTTETYIEVIVQDGGYIQGKVCVTDNPATCGSGAEFDLVFTPGDYSPSCSITAALNQVSTTSGFCDFGLSTFNLVVS